MRGMSVQALVPDHLVQYPLGLEGQGTGHEPVLGDEGLAVAIGKALRHAGQQVASRDNPQSVGEVIDDRNDRPRAAL